MDDRTDRIVPLDELDDFEVDEGDPDVRGWEVLAADGHRIGEVDELLVDTVAMKVRYLDVDLDDDLPGGTPDRHILIPIGYARLDEEDDRIFVDTLSPSLLHGIPDYRHEPVTRDYETQLRTHFDSAYAGSTAPTGADFYAHHLYDYNRFYGRMDGTPDDFMPQGEGDDAYVGPPSEPQRTTAHPTTGDDDARRDRPEFGELGRNVEGDGITPEDDLDKVHGV